MKAENINSTRYLDKKQAKLAIIKIAEEQKWKWWFDNENKLIIDVEDSLEMFDENKS